jgi:hypothetical protein
VSEAQPLVVEGPSFRYRLRREPALVNVSFNMKAGEILCAFGTRPRTWLRADWLRFRPWDYALLGLGLAPLVGSFSLSLLGYGDFWVPQFMYGLFG